MNRIMIWATALLMMVAFVAVAPEANAGLFSKNDCCQPTCCKPKREGLFARMKAKRAAKDCCEPAPCCEPEPCCAPEPTCCEAPAPAPCGCEAVAEPCGCEAAAAPCGCEAEVVTCGCEAPAATCGCEAPAPACGCETASCDCLNRRQLRRAKRKGECCDAEPKTCYSGCSAPVSTCGCEVAVPVEGCSSCSGEIMMESAPAPAEAGEEAAPEAPEAEATT